LNTVIELIEAGADVNATTNDGMHALTELTTAMNKKAATAE